MNIILAGGVKQDKFEKVAETLQNSLQEKRISSSLVFYNVFDSDNLAQIEKEHDVIVSISPGNLGATLPVINGLGLLYPWMGIDEVINDIVEVLNQKQRNGTK